MVYPFKFHMQVFFLLGRGKNQSCEAHCSWRGEGGEGDMRMVPKEIFKNSGPLRCLGHRKVVTEMLLHVEYI